MEYFILSYNDWKSTRSQIKHDHLYKLEVYYTNVDYKDKNRVLLLKSQDDFDKFTKKYGKLIQKSAMTFVLINWKNVSNDFGGIEVSDICDKKYQVKK